MKLQIFKIFFDPWCLRTVTIKIEVVSADRFKDSFINLCNDLSTGIWGSDKCKY